MNPLDSPLNLETNCNKFHLTFRDLNLRTPFYQQTSTYGHFGRDGFPWEKPKTLIIEWQADEAADNAGASCSKKPKLV